jgi:hypothetical protein
MAVVEVDIKVSLGTKGIADVKGKGLYALRVLSIEATYLQILTARPQVIDYLYLAAVLAPTLVAGQHFQVSL